MKRNKDVAVTKMRQPKMIDLLVAAPTNPQTISNVDMGADKFRK